MRLAAGVLAAAVAVHGAALFKPAPATSPGGHYKVHREGSNETRPNFVYFLPDETRAEALSVYGHPITKTPNYERFLDSGAAIFDQAHVGHTQCSPSRTNFITGRYMHVLGHRTQTHLVRSYEDNWLRYLKEAGYYVLWLGKNDMLAAESFPDSVTEWHNLVGIKMGGNAFDFGTAGYYSFLSQEGSELGNSTENGDYAAVVAAVEFMQQRLYEPFFIWIPGMGAHPSYGAPRDYQSLYDPAEIEAKAPLRPPYLPGKPAYHSGSVGIPAFRNLTSLAPKTFYDINSVYLGRVTYSDWIFGQLLDGIERAGLANTTVVAMSADHGDFAGDHNLVEKWPGGLDDILTRVPLMMRVPGAPSGVRVSAPVAAMDPWATIMDLAGVNASHVHFARSLRGALFREPGSYPADDNVVFSEGGFYYDNEIEPNDPSQHRIVTDPKNLYYARFKEELSNYPDASPRAVMIRNSTHKLVWRPRGVSELYDLVADPRELTNRYGDATMASAQAELERQLLVWYTQTADVTPMSDDHRGAPHYYSCVPPDQAAAASRSGRAGSGLPVDVPAMVPCAADSSPSMWRQWQLAADGTVRAAATTGANPAFRAAAAARSTVLGSSSAQPSCLAAGSGPAVLPGGGTDKSGRNVTLEPCDASDASQQFAYDAATGALRNAATGLCLDANSGPDFGQKPALMPCDHATWAGLVWSLLRSSADPTAPLQLQSAESSSWCLGVCASFDSGETVAMSTFGVTEDPTANFGL